MSVPNELPDIGSTAQRLRQNPRFDPAAAAVGPEEYFVWTRFDGATTLRDLILMTGLPTPRAVDIVRKLRTIGAILLPGERPEAVTTLKAAPTPVVVPTPVRSKPDTDTSPTIERLPGAVGAAAAVPLEERSTTRVTASAISVPDVDTDPATMALLAEDVEVTPDERRRILGMARRIKDGDGDLAVLGVGDAADKKAIKRAYFALSKEFHPDRYYGKRMGSFAGLLDEIFEAVSRAYATLSDDRPRRARSPSPDTSQRPIDHAADLFERACQAEVSGDSASAMRLFEATLRLDGQPKYLRRAARCALGAGESRQALEYARKAANLEPNDASTARLLAQAYKASGKLADAEEVLVLALMIKSENDQLARELQTDLAEIRKLASAQR